MPRGTDADVGRPAPTVCPTWAATVVALVFLVPAVTQIILGVNRGPQYADQAEYHLPTVERFAADWPHLNLAAPRAAMTPGYHLLMTAVYRVTGGDVRAVQLATAAITAWLLATLAWAVGRRVGWLDAVLLSLPVAWSPYVITSGVYVVPHNLSWWAVLGALLVALRSPVAPRFYVVSGALLLAAVLTRQIHIWLLAPLAVAAWMGTTECEPTPENAHRAARVLLLLLASLPAVLALAYFVHLWGGLAPKTQDWVRPAGGVNPAALTMMLATCGALGLLFVGYLKPDARGWRWGSVGLLLAAGVALLGPTTYDKAAGRWTGLWNLAATMPAVGGRSVVVTLLAAAGGLVIGWVLAGQRTRDRWVTAAALAGFATAHATVNQAWQRYYEPLVLMVLVLSAARAVGWRDETRSVWVRRGLVAVLSAVQVAMTAMTFRT